MVYGVELSPAAFADLDSIVEHIAEDSIENAYRWQNQLFSMIGKLDLMPRGCSFAPEHEYCLIEVRQFNFGRYRILFTILDDDSLVYIHTVRHSARRFMNADEIEERNR